VVIEALHEIVDSKTTTWYYSCPRLVSRREIPDGRDVCAIAQ
jgi:hypothetical protein